MSDEKKLAGRVALVTGAGKRLGHAVALRLASEGADVAVHYGKSEAEAREVVAEIESLGRRAAAFSAELTDVAAIQKLVQNVASRFARLDILVNCAANFLETKFGETNEATWDATLDTNLKGSFFCAQAAAPHLAKSGRGVIINFADIGGILGWTEYLPHSISKAGVIMLTRILAKELGPAVRVNAIAPGTVTMPGDPPEWQTDYIRRAPMKRTGRPEEIADAVMYLITAEFVTGQVLVVDGGRTL
ncbi:MAG TPA: SDR family oxidoreductase [Candidatus Acidoferrum sp.]|nr:SDR family oxidoreductase [Candidatus Acidoferrum sp.]